MNRGFFIMFQAQQAIAKKKRVKHGRSVKCSERVSLPIGGRFVFHEIFAT